MCELHNVLFPALWVPVIFHSPLYGMEVNEKQQQQQECPEFAPTSHAPHLRFFMPVPVNLIGLHCSMQMSFLKGHPSPAQYISTAGEFHASRHVAIDWDFWFNCTGFAENSNLFLHGDGHQFLIFLHVSSCYFFPIFHWNFKAGL